MAHGCCVDGACNENTCMQLPEGLTCGDCVHVDRCKFLFGVKAGNTHCDFFPRRFYRRDLAKSDQARRNERSRRRAKGGRP